MLEKSEIDSEGAILITSFNNGLSVAYQKVPITKQVCLISDDYTIDQKFEPTNDFVLKYGVLPEGAHGGQPIPREYLPAFNVDTGYHTHFSHDISFINKYLAEQEIRSDKLRSRIVELHESLIAPLGICEVKYWDFDSPLFPNNALSKIGHVLKTLFSPRSVGYRVTNEEKVWNHNRSGEDLALFFWGYNDSGSPQRFNSSPNIVLPSGIKVYCAGGTVREGVPEYCRARWFTKAEDSFVQEIEEIHAEREERDTTEKEFKKLLGEVDHKAFLKHVGFI